MAFARTAVRRLSAGLTARFCRPDASMVSRISTSAFAAMFRANLIVSPTVSRQFCSQSSQIVSAVFSNRIISNRFKSSAFQCRSGLPAIKVRVFGDAFPRHLTLGEKRKSISVLVLIERLLSLSLCGEECLAGYVVGAANLPAAQDQSSSEYFQTIFNVQFV